MSGAFAGQEFDGMVVAVVGGDAGVGPAVVRAFTDASARVVVAGAADAGDPAAFLDECEQQAGAVQVLVMVPPPVKVMSALDVTPEQLRAIVEQELVTPTLLIQECARRMVARGAGGRVISFVSMSGKTGAHPRVAPYAAAKGGLVAYTRSLAAELAPHGITVNAIATALFDAQVAGKSAEEMTKLTAGIPVGRVGRSTEAAHAALYLASGEAGYVTGETLNLSGGRFMD
jgi:NAD(P)-dependent dehydrogenase (short-subunit alcohol dehydrogenase family)